MMLAAVLVATPLGSGLPGLRVTPSFADTGGAAYQTKVLADGADLYYSFDGAATSDGVFSGAGPDATDLTESSGWSAGPELLNGTAVDGASSVTPGSTGGATTCCQYSGEFSWSGWVEIPTGDSVPTSAGLVDAGNYDNVGYTVVLHDGQLEFTTLWGGGADYSQISASYAVEPGVPIMVAVTFDGTDGTIYANGSELTSGAMSAPATEDTPTILIGAYHSQLGTYSTWPGYEDSVAFFPSPLSADLINAEYLIGAPPAPAGSVYQDQVLSDGADAYFPFDGAATSDGVFPGVGPKAGTVGESSSWAAGPELTGDSNQVTDASSVIPGESGGTTSCCQYDGPFSWSGWIEVPSGDSVPSFGGLVDAGNAVNAGFTVDWNSGNLEFVTIQNGSDASVLEKAFTLVPGVPTMVAVTFDGTDGTIYANGQPLGSGAMTAPVIASTPVIIGAYHSSLGSYGPWSGYEDSVAFYPSALSADKVAAEYTAADTCPVDSCVTPDGPPESLPGYEGETQVTNLPDPAGVLVDPGAVEIFTTTPGTDPHTYNVPTATWTAGSTENLAFTQDALSTDDLIANNLDTVAWAPTVEYVDGQYVMWFSGNTGGGANCLVVADSSTAAGTYYVHGGPVYNNAGTCDPSHAGFGMIDPSLFWAEDGSLWLTWSESKADESESYIMARQLSSTGLTWYTSDDPTILTLAKFSDISGLPDTVNGVGYGTGSGCDDGCVPVVENPQLVYDATSAEDPIDVFVSYGSWNEADSYRTVEFGCGDLIGQPSEDATTSNPCDPTNAWDVSALAEGPGNSDVSNPAGMSVAPDGDGNQWALFAAAGVDTPTPRGLFFEPASTVP